MRTMVETLQTVRAPLGTLEMSYSLILADHEVIAAELQKSDAMGVAEIGRYVSVMADVWAASKEVA